MIVSIKDVPLSKTFSNGSLFDRPEAGSPNGGYLAKLLLQAANADVVSGQLAPRVVAVQFISPPTFEPMRIDIELLRMSSNSCFLSVRASQEEHVRTVAHLSFGKSQSGPYHQPAKIPKAPDPETCLATLLPKRLWPHFSQHCEYRVAQSPTAFSGAEHAEMLCWIRIRDLPLDAGNLLFVLDSMTPAFFFAATRWYQTVTTNFNVTYADSFRHQGRGTWVLARVRVCEWAGGWCIEDAEVWSAADGLLLAVGRQMRRVFAQDRKP
jgi:acyl-CoA thioesterase